MKKANFLIGFVALVAVFLVGSVIYATPTSAQTNGEITQEDTPKVIILSDHAFFDGVPTYSIETGPVNGTLSEINQQTSEVTYTPNQNYNGSDSFTFSVDGSDPFSVNISITPVNDDPVITLNGNNPMTVFQFADFVDPGATVADVEDGELQYSTEGGVDTQTIGEYEILYFAYDSGQGYSDATRTVNVVASDNDAPYTTINDPKSNSAIESNKINISGITTDNEAVASTTIAFSRYLTEGDYSYCDYQGYLEIVSLLNQNQTSSFEWSYDWTPPQDGIYCFRAYGEDLNGNKEVEFDRNLVEVENVNFKMVIVPHTEPTPTSSSQSGGRRRPISSTPGEVLGVSTTAPTIPLQEIIPPELKGKVKIIWKTNIESTSKVIYGPTSEGPYKLDTESKNNGYVYSTLENNQKVKLHEVTLDDVVIGLSYSFRVVSKTSKQTFGPEYRFTLGKDGLVKFEGVYGNEIIIGDEGEKKETIHDFVKENNPKIKDLFEN